LVLKKIIVIIPFLFFFHLLGSSKSDQVSQSTQIHSQNQNTRKNLTETPSETLSLMIGVERSSKKMKTYPCLFCMQQDPRPFKIRHSKLKRHLLDKHLNRQEVAAFKDATSQEAQFNRIKNQGAHEWNMEVLEKREGDIIVMRAPSEKEDVVYQSFIPCESCLGWIYKKHLRRHSYNCKVPTIKPMQRGGFNLINKEMTEDCRKILFTLRNDKIGKDTFSLKPIFYIFYNLF